eukprot:3124770-Prymnesium_polylepis.1
MPRRPCGWVATCHWARAVLAPRSRALTTGPHDCLHDCPRDCLNDCPNDCPHDCLMIAFMIALVIAELQLKFEQEG